MILQPRTQIEQADILAQYLRDDVLHEGKNKEGSTLRKVLLGLATEWLNFRDKINEVANEYNPQKTTALIEEWEGFVGIPDSCIPVASTKTLAFCCNFKSFCITPNTVSFTVVEKENDDENPSSVLLTAISVKPSYFFPSTSKINLDVC